MLVVIANIRSPCGCPITVIWRSHRCLVRGQSGPNCSNRRRAKIVAADPLVNETAGAWPRNCYTDSDLMRDATGVMAAVWVTERVP
jgi:hypothetical protein